eukprot:SAG31_NODE_23090_length_511_cov_2.259709_1_plen_50_part_10
MPLAVGESIHPNASLDAAQQDEEGGAYPTRPGGIQLRWSLGLHIRADLWP